VSYFLILRGPLGVGKTTISVPLARALGARAVSIDELLDELPSITWEAGYISPRTFGEANRLAAERAEPLLRSGTRVIFDGNFYWKSQIEDLVERLPYPHDVFTLLAPLAVCLERDRTRAKPLGRKATQDVYRKSTEFSYGIRIDADRPLRAIVDEILARSAGDKKDRRGTVPPPRGALRSSPNPKINRAEAGRRSVPRGPQSPPVD
jgi:predicted kinase